MKKATLVLATAVAFLLSGPVFAARKVVDMPSTGTILSASTSTIAENGILKVSGAALEGEFIPGIKNAIAVVPETKIASTAISSLAKNVIKGGVAGIVVGTAFDQLIKGVGWVMEDGTVVKPATSGSTTLPTPISGDYCWSQPWETTCFASADEACQVASSNYGSHYTGSLQSMSSDGATAVCVRTDGATFNALRSGSGCTSPRVYDSTLHGCALPSSTTPTPVTDSDLGVLDGFIKGQDGVWQRDLTTELCGANEGCYKALDPDTSLTGPAKVTGTPQTVTTTSPSGSVSASVKTPTATITYGPNYYDYSTTTTTTNTNGGDTTTVTDDTDTALPVPPDIFGGANDGIGGIPDAIRDTGSSTSPIPYMAWWSFSQSCSEITFVIPVYGAVTTALCPIYKQYIWPVLYFFFAVFTWFTCFEIWRKTAMRVRAS